MTDIRLSSAGQNVSSLALVSADQVTILGDGTTSNPLRAVAVDDFSGEFTAGFVVDDPVLGKAVRAVAGLTRLATANSIATAATIGLIIELIDGGSIVRCKFRGIVELTTDQWDAVTGQTGGLTVAGVYYLDDNTSDADAGKLSTTPGTKIAQVGVALNVTTMLVGLPAAPVEDL